MKINTKKKIIQYERKKNVVEMKEEIKTEKVGVQLYLYTNKKI